MLPVFLEAQKNETKDIQEIVNVFFGDAKGEARNSLSGEDVYAGMNAIIFTAMGESLEVLSQSSIEVTSVTLDGSNAAIIRYHLIYNGEVIAEDFERLVNDEGTWYLRYKEDPSLTAKKFEALLSN